MSNGANGVHLQLREALENYIKSQYFGKSPILLSAAQNKLNQEGVLYQKPYVESSPAYKSTTNGIQSSPKLPDWLKDYFKALSDANLGVYPSPFCHQISALEAAFEGQDLFVSTGTGSGKTECFMWPLMAKLASEARNSPDSWAMRGVRTIIMYPMNALVSDQISRLRRLIGDPDHRFINIFRTACGNNSRRPQFGMYTGRTPYAGKEPRRSEDRSLAATYSRMVNPENDEEKAFLEKLIKDGKLPAKENFDEFLEKLYNGKHIPNDEDAELVTRFEMQQFCPDILITNYSMLEYMLLRPREHKIWSDTQAWLNADPNNKLLFVIDEAHMYRGSAGGEVSLLIRRLFHRLGINRSRVQFILTTASMPNNNENDRKAVRTFANELTASDDMHPFCYLTGEREEIGSGSAVHIPFSKFKESIPDAFEGDDPERLMALNGFWTGIAHSPAPFVSSEDAYQWLYDHLVDYVPFCQMFKLCRGTAVSLQELAESIFPDNSLEDALHAVSVMLSIAPLARSESGSVLFPARMHIYLYDSLSSGAGYAVSIESSIRQLLTKTRELLEGCTCDSACHRCLKHYRNQYIHSVLNRKAALDLLNWGETGARVSAVPYEKQQYLLKSLEQILRISGIHIDVNHESVWAEGRYSKKKVVVYPAMWTKPIEENTIFVSDAHLKYAKPYALKTILDSL